MNFQSQQIFSIYRISLRGVSCAALLEQHWNTPQPPNYPDLSFEDNKIFQPGTERAPLSVNCAFASLASDPHTQSWELLTAQPTRSSRAKETPVDYSHVLSERHRVSEITPGPGPVTNGPDLLPLSIPERAGNLRVPWPQDKPLNCSSSKPTSCCSTSPSHPAPEAPRGVASSFACQLRDKPPLLRLPREKNLIVLEGEHSTPSCWELPSSARSETQVEPHRQSQTAEDDPAGLSLCVGQLPTPPAAAAAGTGMV